MVEIVLAVSTSLLIWWAASEAHLMKDTDPAAASQMIGKMISFFLFLNLLFRPLRVIADKFNVLQMGMIAGERVFKVLDNEDFIPDSKKGVFAPRTVKGKIEFDQVYFAYTDDRYVLKNISFTIQPGETLAIVGHTGSGTKSIISLLNRL